MRRICEIARMTFVFIVIVLAYAVGVFGLITGWMKATQNPMPGMATYKFISIIVPCRNEEKNIGSLIDYLLVQQYPADKLEIILVNDYSTDNTSAIINDKIRTSTFRCTLVHSSAHGKKSALTDGVALAQGEIILTTDADCTPGRSWVAAVNQSFATENIKMTFGSVKILADKTVFAKMQAIEFASLVGSGAATAGFGFPTMCNGANLAFRKEVFMAVNGYVGNEHIASGDDEFLMRKIDARYSNAIRFNPDKESIVSTTPQAMLQDFFHQRIRWASKWKEHDSTNSKLLAVFIFLFNVFMILLPVFVIVGDVSVYMMLVLWAIKASMEGFFLWRVSAWLGVGWNVIAFFLLQIFYPYYVVISASMGLFFQGKWKGRENRLSKTID